MVIGLTGGIGSGKTTVAKVFETMGCAIYNSDERAKEVYFNSDVKKQVVKLLGKEAYLSRNELNKAFISQKVFSTRDILFQLNAIIHPAVNEDFKLFQSKQSPETIIVKESAILFETGSFKTLDYTVLVIAPEKLKIDRVIKRNAVTKADVLKRMKTQWTDEHKIPLANFVITNDQIKPILPQVTQIMDTLKKSA